MYLDEYLQHRIENVLQLKRKNKEYDDSRYIRLPEGANLKDIFRSTKGFSLVLKFGANWCKPCNAIKEYFKNKTNTHVVTLIDIDVDIHEALQEEYNIKALPTFEFYFLLNDEWVVAQRIEGGNKKELEEAFKKYSLQREI
ncbi:thioredoxin 3, putative (TRX3) [Plasmodium ovale wallikeri]|uniref:Thioredoxin 3, putative (TRX3) n=1 Tax=Plasmodium ovale wallikeri TaxID=864142 RepID=A0A1A9AIK7_PLAOA|nr:thioredoxin 3, putative (TRX3) [Plasmodium ovale wallikeri]SBT56439.1 thioredoxin 3, putative (TRX3) [Plasmodium ovale wallikeri]